MTCEAETDKEYRECLLALFNISPPFIGPGDPAEMCSIQFKNTFELQQTFDKWLDAAGPCIATFSGPRGIGENPRRSSFRELLASVTFQVLSQDPARYEHYGSVGTIHRTIRSSDAWTQPGLLALFRSLLYARKASSPLHLIIDGVHRCDSSWRQLLETFLAIFRDGCSDHSNTKLKIAMFYQDHEDISEALGGLKDSDMPGMVLVGTTPFNPPRDMIAGWIIENSQHLSALQSQIRAALSRCRDITELWFAIQSLQRDVGILPTFKSAEALVEKLPSGVADVIAGRYETLSDHDRVLLGWIACAKRPLSLGELSVAVALNIHDDHSTSLFDHRDLPTDAASRVQHAFGSLLRVDNGKVVFSTDSIAECFIRLIADDKHPTAGHAVLSGREAMEPALPKVTIPDDTYITRILLEYLSMPEFTQVDERLDNDGNIWPQEALFELTTYAVQFWPFHYRAAMELLPSNKDLSSLLKNENLTSLLSKLQPILDPTTSPTGIAPTDSLFLLAAQLGLTDIVEELESLAEPQHRESAITRASWGGHGEIVECLLRDRSGDTKIDVGDVTKALQYASARGHEAIAERLLNHIEKNGNMPWALLDTLLSQASQLGNEKQTRLALSFGADANNTALGLTPLEHAAEHGYSSIVSILLHRANAKTPHEEADCKDKALILAAANGHLGVVDMLLEAHASAKAADGDGCMTLHLAAKNGYSKIVEAVLSHLDNDETSIKQSVIDAFDVFGQTPLITACRANHVDIVQLLLTNGANTEPRDNYGHPALYYAIREGDSALAEFVRNKVSSLAEMGDEEDLFLRAAEYGNTDLVRRYLPILENKELPDYHWWKVEDHRGRTALHLAAEGGWRDCVDLLLNAGGEAALNLRDDDEKFPLSLAAISGHYNIMERLLGNASLREQGDLETILMLVAQATESLPGHAEVVKILINADCDPNATSKTSTRSALHYAAASNKHDVVRALLDCGANPKLLGEWNWNALHYAADVRNVSGKIAELLIESGTDGKELDIDGWLPIHLAVRSGNVQFLDVLYHHYPDCLDVKAADGSISIHFAGDTPETLEWLLKRGVDVGARDLDGRTALTEAISAKNEESFLILIEANADPTDLGPDALHLAVNTGSVKIGREVLRTQGHLLRLKNESDRTALHLAILENQVDFAEMLLDEFYPDPSQKSIENLDAVEESTNEFEILLILAVEKSQKGVTERLLKLLPGPETWDDNWHLALLAAVDKGNMDVIDALLNTDTHRAVVNAGGGARPTALYEAAREGKEDIVERLIKLGADVNQEGGRFNTALSAAAAGGHEDVARILLREKSNASLAGGKFSNALGAALSSNLCDLVDDLIKAGAEVNTKDAQGRTAMHIAASSSSFDTLKFLADPDCKHFQYQHKGDLNAVDEQGRTVLHHAATREDEDIVVGLLEDYRGDFPKLDLLDVDGWTPLLWACRSDNNLEIVRHLVEMGADVGWETKDGWTPENVAVFHGADEVKDLIQEELVKKGTPSSRRDWKLGEDAWQSCDGCLFPRIMGPKWRCQECRDFHFCFKCFWTADKTHPNHTFEAIPEQAGIPVRRPELIEDDCNSSE
ncbi:hypothetical protein Daus18300_011204 [Diaporthe australafricana]|uniref:ZZ-type domain-containing protein n=1 Tax=Diaporthe australafricana TaxID=127596 RepID=A0ABR3W7N4_9PEZI